MELRQLLRGELQRRGWSQSEFGRMVGANAALVSRWLSATTPVVPGPSYCHRIADVLGLPRNQIMSMAGHYEEATESGRLSDPEREIMLREMAAVFDSYDRSHWADLVQTFKAVANLARSGPHGSPDPSPQSSRRGGNHMVPVLPAGDIVWEAVAVVPTSRVRTQLSGPQRQLAGVA
jgi:transcriptional regulator with XRE-family HTH domain